MKQIEFINTNIYGAVTLKDKHAPEQNNMALHVCIDPEQVMKNRQALSQETKISLENWALPWQKHTDRCIEITQNDKGKGAFDKNEHHGRRCRIHKRARHPDRRVHG